MAAARTCECSGNTPPSSDVPKPTPLHASASGGAAAGARAPSAAAAAARRGSSKEGGTTTATASPLPLATQEALLPPPSPTTRQLLSSVSGSMVSCVSTAWSRGRRATGEERTANKEEGKPGPQRSASSSSSSSISEKQSSGRSACRAARGALGEERKGACLAGAGAACAGAAT